MVWQMEPPALPAFDASWKERCVGCAHVDVDTHDTGVTALRCKRSRLIGGRKKVTRDVANHAYCIDALDECRENGWHEPADA